MMNRSLSLLLSCLAFSLAVLLPLRMLLSGAFVGSASAPVHSKADDIDGDGKAEIILAGPVGNNMQWNVVNAESRESVSFALGSAAGVPVLGDYNGDGLADIGIYIPGFESSPSHPDNWEIWLSDREKQRRGRIPAVEKAPLRFSWGRGAHIAVPADYDGDGKTDLAVFDPESGIWHVAFSSGGPNLVKATLNEADSGAVVQWGLPGDLPVPGDYDGDKKADFAVVRRAVNGENLQWLIKYSSGGDGQWVLGEAGDIPLAADFDGDGKADAAVFRSASSTGEKGEWTVRSDGGHVRRIQWCEAGYEPLARDFDGDGRADFGCFAPEKSPGWDIRLSRVSESGQELFADKGPGEAVQKVPFSGELPAGIMLRAHQFK